MINTHLAIALPRECCDTWRAHVIARFDIYCVSFIDAHCGFIKNSDFFMIFAPRMQWEDITLIFIVFISKTISWKYDSTARIIRWILTGKNFTELAGHQYIWDNMSHNLAVEFVSGIFLKDNVVTMLHISLQVVLKGQFTISQHRLRQLPHSRRASI